MIRGDRRQIPWFVVGLVIGVIGMAVLAPAEGFPPPSEQALTSGAQDGSGAFCRVAGSRYFFDRDFEAFGKPFRSFERWCAERHSPVEFAP